MVSLHSVPIKEEAPTPSEANKRKKKTVGCAGPIQKKYLDMTNFLNEIW